MNPADIPLESTVMLSSGDRAEVLSIDSAAYTVQVRLLDSLGDPGLEGSESWISADDVIAIDEGGHVEGRT